MLTIERAKYERWVMNEVEALLDREFNRVVDILLSSKFRTLSRFQRQRTLQLFRELDRRLGAGYRDVTELVLREMRGYAQLEAEVARIQATSTLGTAAGNVGSLISVSLPKAYLEAIATLPIQGLRIGEWFEAQAQTMSREVRRIIQQGMVEGKGPAEIARRIVADARAQGPVLSRRAKSDARIISRTTVNAVQNDGALASYERLPESVSDSYRLLVVRDSRTSTICAALADRVFRYDDPKRLVPPFHLNCRTGVLPILRGAETSIGEQKTGPMSMGAYSDWLRAQPITAQNQILGATRASVWREGRMSLADAIDADNRVLSLKELRASLGLTTRAPA
jgi:SPP1 gp7 family putative phage head morphogenesis protein